MTAVVELDYAPTIAPGSWIVVNASNRTGATENWSNSIVNGALDAELNFSSLTAAATDVGRRSGPGSVRPPHSSTYFASIPCRRRRSSLG